MKASVAEKLHRHRTLFRRSPNVVTNVVRYNIIMVLSFKRTNAERACHHLFYFTVKRLITELSFQRALTYLNITLQVISSV